MPHGYLSVLLLLLSANPIFAQVHDSDRESDSGFPIQSVRQRIDEYLSRSVENGFSGAVLVAKDGDIIFNKGFGFAEKENQLAITENTVFDIGSVTKQFTGAAILILESQGKLKTSDAITKYFDNLPEDKKVITVHQLLTHTSGLVDTVGDGDFDHIPKQAYFDALFNADLLHQPGETHVYSNAGYSALAYIIEKVSGQGYEEFLREHLFAPAGMNQTGYLLPPWNKRELAHGYPRNVMAAGSMIERYLADQKVSWSLKGNGGINSTQRDMFKWYTAIKSEKVLSQSQIRRWTTPYVAEQDDASSHYAYGWAIYNSKRDTRIVSHNGGNGAYFHDFIWLPEEDAVIIFSCNAASRKVESVAWQIEKIIFDESYRPERIPKNPYFLVVDFTEHHQASESTKLRELIQDTHSADFQEAETLNRVGYLLLRSGKQLDWAVAIFEINSQLFPEDSNVWDSLGDGYLAHGQKTNAINAFRKAVELGSRETGAKLRELMNDK